MKIKTFALEDQKAANDFIDSAVLLPDGAVQVTGSNNIVIFYEETKDKYEKYFVDNMLSSLKKNLFHEQVRQASAQAEVDYYKANGGKSNNFDKAIKNVKESTDNIEVFEAKITALESWTVKPTSKT